VPNQSPAVLFDWDGTLLDSGPGTTTAWRIVLDELGHDCSNPLLASLFLRGWPAAYVRLAEEWPMPDQRQVLDRLGQVRRGLPRARLFDDAPAAMAGLRRLGVRIALVTNSSHDRLANEMRGLLRATDFATIVTADASGRAKPAPDPYLYALRLLDHPISALAIEDSPIGVDSATAASVPVLLIDRGMYHSDLTVPTINRLDPDEIVSFLGTALTT
jgi:beta-phosphoglucomutase-like phosphatase (HAD superfamily)